MAHLTRTNGLGMNIQFSYLWTYIYFLKTFPGFFIIVLIIANKLLTNFDVASVYKDVSDDEEDHHGRR